MYYNENYHSVIDSGAVGDGRSDNTGAIRAALEKAAGESPENTLYFPPGTYRLAGSLTLPETMDIVFEEGAVLQLDAGVRLQLLGHIAAGPYPLFAGEGEVTGHFNNTCIYPQWYGARGDGETDDTQAFRKALQNGGALALPATEKGYVLRDIVIDSMKDIYGCDREKTLLIGHPEAEYLFSLRSQNIKIRHLTIDMSRTGESSCFYFDIAPGRPVSYNEISDIEVHQAYHVVSDSRRDKRTDKVYITNTVLEKLRCFNSRQTAIRTRNFWGFIFMRDILLDNSRLQEITGLSGNYPALEIEDNEGGILQNIQIKGTGDSHNNGEVGFLYTRDVATWMDDCRVENVGGDGLQIRDGGYHLYFSNVDFSGIFGNGMTLQECFYPQIHHIRIVGRAGEASSREKAVGILGERLIDAQINGVQVTRMTGDAVVLSNSRYNIVSHLEAADNQGLAFQESDGSDCNIHITSGKPLPSAMIAHCGRQSGTVYTQICKAK